MNNWDTVQLVADGKRYFWHPFISREGWCAPVREAIVMMAGKEAIVRDSRGREYVRTCGMIDAFDFSWRQPAGGAGLPRRSGARAAHAAHPQHSGVDAAFVISMRQLKNALNVVKQSVQPVLTSQLHQFEAAPATF